MNAVDSVAFLYLHFQAIISQISSHIPYDFSIVLFIKCKCKWAWLVFKIECGDNWIIHLFFRNVDYVTVYLHCWCWLLILSICIELRSSWRLKNTSCILNKRLSTDIIAYCFNLYNCIKSEKIYGDSGACIQNVIMNIGKFTHFLMATQLTQFNQFFSLWK